MFFLYLLCVVTHTLCETPHYKAVTIFFYLEDMLLKFSSASLSIVSKQEIQKVTTYLAHITIIAS